MSVPFSGILRLPSMLRIASGRSGDAVGASGKRARKSATASTSECPISRNFSGGKSDGAERLLSPSEFPVVFLLRLFLVATLDLGTCLTHSGGPERYHRKLPISNLPA